jgi:hypothetical protein
VVPSRLWYWGMIFLLVRVVGANLESGQEIVYWKEVSERAGTQLMAQSTCAFMHARLPQIAVSNKTLHRRSVSLME